MADSGKFCVLSCLERQSEQPFVLLKLSNKFTLITYAFNTYQPSMQKSVLLTLSKKIIAITCTFSTCFKQSSQSQVLVQHFWPITQSCTELLYLLLRNLKPYNTINATQNIWSKTFCGCFSQKVFFLRLFSEAIEPNLPTSACYNFQLHWMFTKVRKRINF